MICEKCGSEMSNKFMSVKLDRGIYKVYVDEIPVLQCVKCNEVFMAEKDKSNLKKIGKTLESIKK